MFPAAAPFGARQKGQSFADSLGPASADVPQTAEQQCGDDDDQDDGHCYGLSFE
jgi:hypothetical protein